MATTGDRYLATSGDFLMATDTGDRPIAITWRLEKPMPMDFFNHASAVAQ